MTKAMPFLQKAILLSYDPRRFCRGCCFFGLRDGPYRFSCFSASMGFSLRIFRVA